MGPFAQAVTGNIGDKNDFLLADNIFWHQVIMQWVYLKGIYMVKSWPGPDKNILYCTRQLRRIQLKKWVFWCSLVNL